MNNRHTVTLSAYVLGEQVYHVECEACNGVAAHDVVPQLLRALLYVTSVGNVRTPDHVCIAIDDEGIKAR